MVKRNDLCLGKCFLISESHEVMLHPVKHFKMQPGINILTSRRSRDGEPFKRDASCIQFKLCI